MEEQEWFLSRGRPLPTNMVIHAVTPLGLAPDSRHLLSTTTTSAMAVPEAPLEDQVEAVDQRGATPADLEVDGPTASPEDLEEVEDPGGAEGHPVDHLHLHSDQDGH